MDDWYFLELTIKPSFYQKNTGEKIDIQKKKYWYQLHARNIYDQALYNQIIIVIWILMIRKIPCEFRLINNC